MNNRQEIERLYGHHLDGFIREVNPQTSRDEILSQMGIHPVMFEDKNVGIIGMNTQKTKVGALACIRLIYLEPSYRGDKMGLILEQLFDKLVLEGFTQVESWALPHIATWLETNWKLRPKLFVYNEDLQKLRQKIKVLKSTGK